MFDRIRKALFNNQAVVHGLVIAVHAAVAAVLMVQVPSYAWTVGIFLLMLPMIGLWLVGDTLFGFCGKFFSRCLRAGDRVEYIRVSPEMHILAGKVVWVRPAHLIDKRSDYSPEDVAAAFSGLAHRSEMVRIAGDHGKYCLVKVSAITKILQEAD